MYCLASTYQCKVDPSFEWRNSNIVASLHVVHNMAIRVMEFLNGGVQNWKDFCLKTNIPTGNYWILRIDVKGRCPKVSKFDFQKSYKSFSFFFALKNINLGAHFLLMTLIAWIYKSFPKMVPHLWHLANSQNSIISFRYVYF